ncbi:hypothetical protein GWI33_008389 [Rhynchophorus ferrugineus]|uniref:Uncharacterized protein n=1 Tax=Rhynchophorus ferrugineus TaxID=354439 RepID=A0A834MCA9_RHYFE|nr:hypothetical protein GWI33_008389 [Rhynchophorus ferrugineus]
MTVPKKRQDGPFEGTTWPCRPRAGSRSPDNETGSSGFPRALPSLVRLDSFFDTRNLARQMKIQAVTSYIYYFYIVHVQEKHTELKSC